MSASDFNYDQFYAVFDDKIDELMKFWENNRYVGFDPESIVAILIKLKLTYMEISELVFLYLGFGANIDNITTPEGKALLKKAGVKRNANTNKAADPTITLPRIAAVFPEVVAAAYDTGLVRPVVLGEKAGGKVLPDRFCFPSAPAIMTDQEWSTYKEAWLATMVKFHRRINVRRPDQRDKTPDEIKAEQEVYATAAHESDFSRTNFTKKIDGFKFCQKSFGVIANQLGKAPKVELK